MVSELHFNDVHVPVANMVTPPGKGFAAAMKTLDGGRIGIASQALGIAEGAFEIARKYLMQREQFKKPLYKNQHLAFRMVDLANEIELAKYMVYKAAVTRMTTSPSPPLPLRPSSSPQKPPCTSPQTPCRCWAATAS